MIALLSTAIVVNPKSFAMLAKLRRKTCGVMSESDDALSNCSQWLGTVAKAMSSP
jgi:hypothetical protein